MRLAATTDHSCDSSSRSPSTVFSGALCSPRQSQDSMKSGEKTFQARLERLPVATVSEKLRFPLKFEKESFCLDFQSGGSTTSDCEPTSVKQIKVQKTRDLTSKLNLKKKFNSAEKYRVRNEASPSNLLKQNHFPNLQASSNLTVENVD